MTYGPRDMKPRLLVSASISRRGFITQCQARCGYLSARSSIRLECKAYLDKYGIVRYSRSIVPDDMILRLASLINRTHKIRFSLSSYVWQDNQIISEVAEILTSRGIEFALDINNTASAGELGYTLLNVFHGFPSSIKIFIIVRHDTGISISEVTDIATDTYTW
jgi:hypothetical protein